MITLRPDQLETVQRLREALRDHQSVLLRAPCGFGKTVVASYMADGAHRKRKRVIFAVHRRELARQTARTFDQFGIPYGFIMAGISPNPFAPVQIASRDTIRNRPKLLGCDLFIPDEAHLWGSGGGAEIIDTVRQMGAHIVPLTATPARGDGKPMRRIADIIVSGPSEKDLIKAGNLARYRPIAPVRPDLSKLHVRAGEYVASEVEELMGPGVAKDAVKFYRQFAMGKRMIGFSPSRKRGAEYAAEFTAAGIPAAFIDGETPDNDRRRIIAMFASGAIQVLMNCQLFMEGFDLSAQVGYNVPIQAVGLYNPCKSEPRAVQMMMRPMRPQDDYAIILDHACIMVNRDGTINHGFPDDDREWSLDGRATGKGNSEATIPTVTCSSCFAVFRPALVCPYCDAPRLSYAREVEEFEAQLAEMDPEKARFEADLMMRRKTEMAREVSWAKTLEELVNIGMARNYKMPGWAISKWQYKGKGNAITDQTWRDARKFMMAYMAKKKAA